jgi:hypoxanthine phosphoribosyltransferase
LLTEETIRERVQELGREISRDYAGCELLLVGILKGAFIFLADLARCLTVPVWVDFMAAASYGDSYRSSGEALILRNLEKDIRNLHVLLVEDIIDTGLTIQCIRETLQKRGPASLKICALLDKPGRRLVEIKPDYKGFTIPDEFVVGYGLDFRDNYRCLKDIMVLRQEAR